MTSYGYTGQWREALTGLQYHRARWLDPGTGRWLSVDPVFDFPGNYGHPYAYVGMNPVGNTDLSGETSLLSVVGAVANLNIVAQIALGAFVLRFATGLITGEGLSKSVMKGLLYATLAGLIAYMTVALGPKAIVAHMSGLIGVAELFVTQKEVSMDELVLTYFVTFIITLLTQAAGALAKGTIGLAPGWIPGIGIGSLKVVCSGLLGMGATYVDIKVKHFVGLIEHPSEQELEDKLRRSFVISAVYGLVFALGENDGVDEPTQVLYDSLTGVVGYIGEKIIHGLLEFERNAEELLD